MSVVDTKVRPPYVRFSRRAIEDRTTEKTKGKYGFRDVDIAHITIPGQKDTVERFVDDWLADLQKMADDGRIPFEWPEKFTQAYKYWQNGQEMPVEGTPIKGWPVLQPAQQENLIMHGVLTVEDLANASDEAIQRIGIGMQSYKQKALAWLKEASNLGTVAAENATLKRDLEAAAARIETQQKLLEEMRAELDALKPAKPKVAI